MSRSAIKGLHYFNIDVKQEDNLNFVEAKHGLLGYAIVVKLWRKIYMIDGYYCDWGERNIFLFAREVGIDMSIIADVVETCFQERIFNRDKYNEFKILTSHGIQYRYMRIVKDAKRKDCLIEVKYSLLITHRENEPLIPEELSQSPGIINESPGKSTQSKVKENKEEKKSGAFTLPPTDKNFIELLNWMNDNANNVLKMDYALNEKEFQELNSKYGIEEVKRQLVKMNNHKPLLKTKSSAFQTLLQWITTDFSAKGNISYKAEVNESQKMKWPEGSVNHTLSVLKQQTA